MEEALKRIWREEGRPEKWKEGMIIPIRKKGGRIVEEYKGVTFNAHIVQGIYNGVTGKIKGEGREEGNTNILDRIQKRNGDCRQHIRFKLCGKQADKQERGKASSVIYKFKSGVRFGGQGGTNRNDKKKGIKKVLIRRVKEVLRKTKNRLRVGGELGKSFWTARGMKQGCLLNPPAI